MGVRGDTLGLAHVHGGNEAADADTDGPQVVDLVDF